MKCIVGLGNPGQQYEHTRHNVGFKAIDKIAEGLNISSMKARFKGLYALAEYQQEKVLLLKPMTFMNRSGEALAEICHFYQLSTEDVLIIYDDMDLANGRIRLRFKGGDGGHNGLKSIIAHLGTKEFKRIRIGIGRPEQGDIVSYVLGLFSAEEREANDQAIDNAAQASLAFILERDFTKTMNQFNV